LNEKALKWQVTTEAVDVLSKGNLFNALSILKGLHWAKSTCRESGSCY